MSTEPFRDDDIVPHDQFVAQMEQEKRARYARGTAALILVAATIVLIGFSITQLAGGAGVFTN